MKLRVPALSIILAVFAVFWSCNQVHAQQPTHILVKWIAPTPNLDYSASTVYTYEVSGGPKGGPYVVIPAAATVSGLQFLDGPLPLGEKCYTLKANAPDGKQSPASAEVCATILLVKGPVPGVNTPSASVVP